MCSPRAALTKGKVLRMPRRQLDPKEGKIQKDLTYRGRKTGGDEELSPSLAKTMLSPVSRFMVGVSREQRSLV